LKKNNNKISIITVFSTIMITILIGAASIFASMYIINGETSENLILLTNNKASFLEKTFKIAEITTTEITNYIEDSFSSEKLEKYGAKYLTDYTHAYVPMMENILKNTDKVKGIYFNFAPEIVKSNTVYEVWVYDKKESRKNFDIVLTEPVSNYFPEDKADLQWYYKPKNTGRPVWTEVYYDQTLDVPMISYIRPVYSNKKFIGTVGMDMSIQRLREMIFRLKIYQSGYAFLLSKDLKAVVHKDLHVSETLAKINKPLYLGLKSSLIKHDKGILIYEEDDIQNVACYKKLNNGLIFVITVPKAEMLRQKFNIQILLGGISLLSMVMAFLIIINKD